MLIFKPYEVDIPKEKTPAEHNICKRLNTTKKKCDLHPDDDTIVMVELKGESMPEFIIVQVCCPAFQGEVAVFLEEEKNVI